MERETVGDRVKDVMCFWGERVEGEKVERDLVDSIDSVLTMMGDSRIP